MRMPRPPSPEPVVVYDVHLLSRWRTLLHLDPSTEVGAFLHEAFQRVSIRLVSTLAMDRGLRVESHVDLARRP